MPENKQQPLTKQQVETMQKQVNQDQQRNLPDNKNHIPLTFDETMRRISQVPPEKKK